MGHGMLMNSRGLPSALAAAHGVGGWSVGAPTPQGGERGGAGFFGGRRTGGGTFEDVAGAPWVVYPAFGEAEGLNMGADADADANGATFAIAETSAAGAFEVHLLEAPGGGINAAEVRLEVRAAPGAPARLAVVRWCTLNPCEMHSEGTRL
jgi:hypothetical protein